MEQKTTSDPAPTVRKKTTKRTKLILWLMLGPTVLIAASFIAFSIANLAFGTLPNTLPEACADEPISITAQPSAECQEELLGQQTPIQMAINTFLSLALFAGVFAWLPGLIIGAVLLIKRRETPTASNE